MSSSALAARPSALSRRRLLGGAAALAVGGVLSNLGASTASAAQRVLKFTFHAQETGYSCSAGSTKMALSARGINVPESTLRRELQLTPSVGLPNANNMVRTLNAHLKSSVYVLRSWSSLSDYTRHLDADVKYSIDHGYSVIFSSWYYNVGHNKPVRSRSGHLLTIQGYSDTQYYIGDPASSKNGPGFWVNKSTLVSWRKYQHYVAIKTTGPLPPVSPWPVLKSGSTGFRVNVVQHLLRQRGASALKVDGSYGPLTVGAVKSFQAKAKLQADGVVGPKTWAALVAVVKSGAKGDLAKAAQVALNGNGAKIAVDGSFGTASVAATKAFQKAHKLSVDGVVGPNTWAALV